RRAGSEAPMTRLDFPNAPAADETWLAPTGITYRWNATKGVWTTVNMPSGPEPSGWRLIERIVPTAGQTTVDFTAIPPDINDIEIRFDVQPQNNDVTLWGQFYDGSGSLVTANYNWSTSMQQSNAAANDPVLQRSGGAANTAAQFALSYWGIGYGISSA